MIGFTPGKLISRLLRDERGIAAPIFAGLLPVLLLGVGVAIDYGRAANARSAMQAAVDSAALMVSKDAADLTPTQLTTRAESYFYALFGAPEVTGITLSASYATNTGSGASVVINAAGTIHTDFMKLAGYPTVSISATSTTRWGHMRYRVALALDNTGSMAADDKINQLKLATKQLIEDFYGMSANNDDVYISIIPFSKDVNVGTANKDASWLRWTEWEERNGSCSGSGSYKTKTSCQNAGRTWTVASHDTWNGCVMDRDQSYDVSTDGVGASPTGAMAPAEQYSGCPVSILGMTSVRLNKQDLINKVDAMTPTGMTNQAIGLAWGFKTLQASGPFTGPPKDNNSTYWDVVVLLTDGLNTQNRWGSSQSAIDTRQSTLCSNIKSVGTKIFAVQVATNGDPVSEMLKACTTDPSNPNYFSYITEASQMTVKFQSIFKELARLRIAS